MNPKQPLVPYPATRRTGAPMTHTTQLAVTIEHDTVSISDPLLPKVPATTIVLQRTLRIPDDGREWPLPPGLGNFPLRTVESLGDKAPIGMRQRGGIVVAAPPLSPSIATCRPLVKAAYDVASGQVVSMAPFAAAASTVQPPPAAGGGVGACSAALGVAVAGVWAAWAGAVCKSDEPAAIWTAMTNWRSVDSSRRRLMG